MNLLAFWLSIAAAALVFTPRVQAQDPLRQAPALDIARIKALTRIGSLESAQECEQLATAAIKSTSSSQGGYLYALAVHELGSCLFNAGSYVLAESSYRKSAALFESLGDSFNQGASLNGIGSSLLSQGDYGQAIKLLSEIAIPLEVKSLNIEAEASGLITLGTAYIFSNRFEQAVLTLTEARRKSERLPDGYFLAGANANLGFAQLELGQIDAAITHLSEGASYFRASGAFRGGAYAANGLCKAITAKSGPSIGEKCFQKAIGDFQSVSDPYIRAALQNNQAVALELSGNYDSALYHLVDAYAIVHAEKLDELQGRTLANMMRVLARTDKRDEAIIVGIEAIRLFEQVRSSFGLRSNPSTKSFIGSKQDTYRELVRLLVDADRILEAQYVIKLLKDEEFSDFVRGGPSLVQAVLPRSDEINVKERLAKDSKNIVQLTKELTRLREQSDRDGGLNPIDQTSLDALENEVANGRERFFAVITELARKPPSRSGFDTLPSNLKYLDSLRGTLGELGAGTILLTYIVEGDELFIFVTSEKTVGYRRVRMDSKALSKKIFLFRESIDDYRNISRAQLLEQSAALYTDLVGPIKDDLNALGAKTIMLSLDRSLRYLPFAALYDGTQYFVEKYALSTYTPAATPNLKDALRQPWRMAGLGLSKQIKDFRPLFYVPEELTSIVKSGDKGIFDGEICMDECFTLPALQKYLRSGYKVVHIATHFVFSPGNESTSYLLFGDGRQLSLREIQTLGVDFQGVDLLTLSACDTAMGAAEVNGGAEIEGLGVLAQNQGAKAVMATLWQAHDVSTARLMTSFYLAQSLSVRTNKVESLRLAQIAMIHPQKIGSEVTAEANRFTHPYFWAAFMIMGNWK